MPLTPLHQVKSYTDLTNMAGELSAIAEVEIYDPEALTRRCAEMATDVHRAVNVTLAQGRAEAILLLRQMVDDRKVPPQIMDKLAPRLLAVYASEEELNSLASLGSWSYSTLLLLRVADRIFLLIAFVVSFLVTELVSNQFPDAWSTAISRLIVGVAAFTAQLAVFGNLGERLAKRIQWRLFHRARRRLLAAIRTFCDICMRVWTEIESLIPEFVEARPEDNGGSPASAE